MKKIAMVIDRYAHHESVQKVLLNNGYEISTAEEVSLAPGFITDPNTFDLLVLGETYCQTRGWHLLPMLRQRPYGAIIVTGSGDKSTRVSALLHGADVYFVAEDTRVLDAYLQALWRRR